MRCLVCGLQGPDKFTRPALEWDWFHGHLSTVVEFCPEHKTNELRERLFGISRTRPETWTPAERDYNDAALHAMMKR